MDKTTVELLRDWAETYNNPAYFREDPIAFPARFAEMKKRGTRSLKDIETAAVFASHFAWGRRAMIVRDCTRLFDHMDWKPYDYVMKGEWRSDDTSIHRTVKWSEVAAICSRLKDIYERVQPGRFPNRRFRPETGPQGTGQENQHDEEMDGEG